MTHSAKLADSKSKATTGNSTDAPITIVAGNEAADLDSIACATAMAAILSVKGECCVPYVCVPRDDLPLRPDAQWLLEDAGVDAREAIVFADELDIHNLASEGRLKSLILVDHNAPAGPLAGLASNVSRVVDHHENSGTFASTDAVDVTIEMVGSCSTLVWGELEKAGIDDPALRRLLLGAVLLDTQNLGDGARHTNKDAQALASLAAEPALRPGETAAALYEELKRRRFDQSNLSARDLLRRDYKQWRMGAYEVGIASFGVPFQDACSLLDALGSFRDERGVDFLVCMSAFNDADNNFKRQLLLSGGKEPGVAESLKAMGLSLEKQGIGIQALDDGSEVNLNKSSDSDVLCFIQKDVKQSRKQIQPCLLKFFEQQQSV